MPKMSLEDAVGKETAESWTNAAKQNTLKHAPDFINRLSDDELGALYGYTTNEGYTALNPALRGVNTLTPELEAFSDHAINGLSKLPVYGGATSRGIESLPSHVLESNQIGNIVSDGAFMSTSSAQPFPGEIQIMVKGTSGKDISFLSEYNHEAEVLYPPATKFEVMQRVEHNGRVHLSYEERP